MKLVFNTFVRNYFDFNLTFEITFACQIRFEMNLFINLLVLNCYFLSNRKTWSCWNVSKRRSGNTTKMRYPWKECFPQTGYYCASNLANIILQTFTQKPFRRKTRTICSTKNRLKMLSNVWNSFWFVQIWFKIKFVVYNFCLQSRSNVNLNPEGQSKDVGSNWFYNHRQIQFYRCKYF